MSVKKLVASFAVGLVMGALCMVLVVANQAPKLMIVEDASRYDFATTVEKFEQAVKDAGWSIPKVHDMQATLKGFGHEIDNVTIFDLCSSKYSAVILAKDEGKIVAPMMPCRVAMYTKSDGKTYIARMNSALVAKLYGGLINEVMEKAYLETEAIVKPLM